MGYAVKYVVVEMQTNADGTVGNIVTAYDTRAEAESAYHTALAAAALSGLPCHAVVLLTTEGGVIEFRRYKHPVAEEAQGSGGGGE